LLEQKVHLGFWENIGTVLNKTKEAGPITEGVDMRAAGIPAGAHNAMRALRHYGAVLI